MFKIFTADFVYGYSWMAYRCSAKHHE